MNIIQVLPTVEKVKGTPTVTSRLVIATILRTLPLRHRELYGPVTGSDARRARWSVCVEESFQDSFQELLVVSSFQVVQDMAPPGGLQGEGMDKETSEHRRIIHIATGTVVGEPHSIPEVHSTLVSIVHDLHSRCLEVVDAGRRLAAALLM